MTWIGKGTSLLRVELGGQGSNPLLQDQNLLCYRLHHPPIGDFIEDNGDSRCDPLLQDPVPDGATGYTPPIGDFIEDNGDSR